MNLKSAIRVHQVLCQVRTWHNQGALKGAHKAQCNAVYMTQQQQVYNRPSICSATTAGPMLIPVSSQHRQTQCWTVLTIREHLGRNQSTNHTKRVLQRKQSPQNHRRTLQRYNAETVPMQHARVQVHQAPMLSDRSTTQPPTGHQLARDLTMGIQTIPMKCTEPQTSPIAPKSASSRSKAVLQTPGTCKQSNTPAAVQPSYSSWHVVPCNRSKLETKKCPV